MQHTRGMAERAARIESKGDTPLHDAAMFGEIATVEVLVAHKAEVNAVTKAGLTPLDYAMRVGITDDIKAGKAKIVPFLREHGAKTGQELK